MLPSLAVGSVMVEVGPMSVKVVVIVFAFLVVEEAMSGKRSGSVVILMHNSRQVEMLLNEKHLISHQVTHNWDHRHHN